VGVVSEEATAQVASPSLQTVSPSGVVVAGDVGELSSTSFDSGVLFGPTSISADLLTVALSIPPGWDISSFIAARRARASGKFNGLDLFGDKNSVDLRRRD
jgi:hypothetical protein